MGVAPQPSAKTETTSKPHSSSSNQASASTGLAERIRSRIETRRLHLPGRLGYEESLDWSRQVLKRSPLREKQRLPYEVRNRVEKLSTSTLSELSEGLPKVLDSSKPSPPPKVDRSKDQDDTSVFLTIASVRDAVMENHLDLKIELLRPRIALEATRVAEAGFDPSLFASSTWGNTLLQSPLRRLDTRTDATSVGVRVPLASGGRISVSVPLSDIRNDQTPPAAGSPAQTGQRDSSVAMTFSQPLLRNAGRLVATAPIVLARLGKGQVDANAKLQVTSLLANAERSYWIHWGASRQVEIRRHQYDLATTLEKQIGKLVKGGLIAEVEQVRTRAGVTRRVGAVLRAETTRRNTEYDLLRIMNRPDMPIGSKVDLITRTQPFLGRYELDPESLLLEANEHRMDLLAAELQWISDRLSDKVARRNVRPNLNFDWSLNRAQQTLSGGGFILNDRQNSWNAVLSLDVPFGNRAQLARSRQARIQKLLSLKTLEQRRLQIRQDVYGAVQQLDLTWQLILAARQDTRAAQSIFEAEQKQFDLGLRTSTEVLEAAQFLADAQISEAVAMRDYELAKIDLALSTGMLLGYRGIRLDSIPAAKPEPSGQGG